MLAGKLSNADPTRGRFRDYVKTTVLNEVRQFIRKSKLRNSVLQLRDIDLLEDADAGGRSVAGMSRRRFCDDPNSVWRLGAKTTTSRLQTFCGGRRPIRRPTQTLAEFLSELRVGKSPPNARKLVQRSREKLQSFYRCGRDGNLARESENPKRGGN